MRSLQDTTFPYPFSGWTQEWHGIWWEEILVSAAHDVASALGTSGASPVLDLFQIATKRTRRAVIMSQCPLFVMQLPGERLGELPRGHKRVASITEPGQFQDWVWSTLQARVALLVRIRNVPMADRSMACSCADATDHSECAHEHDTGELDPWCVR